MAVDERARRHLHERLDAAIGPQAADVLMEELTLLGREQLATRHDIELLRRDMDIGFATLRGEMSAGFATLRGELYQQLGAQRDRIDSQTRQLIFWMLGAMLTVAAMAFGAAQLT